PTPYINRAQDVISIPSIRSVCCPLHLPRIRIAPPPCSAGTISGAWFENRARRDNSRSRLSSSRRHHGLSTLPLSRPWSSSHLGLRRIVSRLGEQLSSMCLYPSRLCRAVIRLPETRFPSLDTRPDSATRAAW